MSGEDKPSKTSRKREATALQALGEQLTQQPSANLDRLPLEPALREAIDEYGKLTKRLARRRQLQFIGRLMRAADAEAIVTALAALAGGSLERKQRERSAERWQARLMEEGDSALAELVDAHPTIDRQRLRALLRQCARRPEDEDAAKTLRNFLMGLTEG